MAGRVVTAVLDSALGRAAVIMDISAGGVGDAAAARRGWMRFIPALSTSLDSRQRYPPGYADPSPDGGGG
jgi:hypothetical protein